MIDQEVIDDLKNRVNWETVLKYGNGLDDCNDKQWRFIKGLVIELATAKHSKNLLTYVGEDHKDFDWTERNLTVELKSQMSAKLYDKKGKLAKKFSIRLNNSNGTNKSTILDPAIVADIIIVPRSNGVFIIDKDTVMKYYKHKGDGFDVIFPNTVITEITGRKDIEKKTLGLKQIILDAIQNAIP